MNAGEKIRNQAQNLFQYFNKQLSRFKKFDINKEIAKLQAPIIEIGGPNFDIHSAIFQGSDGKLYIDENYN
jgi:hypothetical protein